MKKLLYIFLLGLIIVFSMTTIAMASSPDDNYRQMLTNSQHLLAPDYAPSSLVRLNNYMRAGSSVMLTAEAAAACEQMVAAMNAEGLTDIYGQSGYRSYATQKTLNDNKVASYRNQGYSREEAERLAGRIVHIPGASEHQLGLAIDFTTSANGNSLTEDFATTPVGLWLTQNSWKYGFVLRYPKNKESVTNIIYEPWHYRYVGQPHAEYLYRNNLCLEEYYAQLQTGGVITYAAYDNTEYAIFYTDHNNVQNTGSVLRSVSRAYPETTIGYITTTTVPVGSELFDIIGHWGESYIRALSTMEIITGYPNNTFLPEKNITRAELVSLTVRVFDLLYPEGSEQGVPAEVREHVNSLKASLSSPYSDVPAGSYYLEPLVIAEQMGLLAPGMIKTNENYAPVFLPDNIVLRREAAQSLAPLFAGEINIPASGIVLNDMANEDPALQNAVQLLVDAGILTGDNQGLFNGDSNITRAEISAMLYRILVFFEFFPEMYPEESNDAAVPDASEEAADIYRGIVQTRGIVETE